MTLLLVSNHFFYFQVAFPADTAGFPEDEDYLGRRNPGRSLILEGRRLSTPDCEILAEGGRDLRNLLPTAKKGVPEAPGGAET